MLFQSTKKFQVKLFLGFALGWGLMFSSASIMATTTENLSMTKSIAYSQSDEIDRAGRDVLLQQADIDTKGPLSREGYRSESGSSTKITLTSSYINSPDFSLYNASTELISNFDDDGFYHRFSVNIDADTVYQTAYVYARLYLSYEGGPWNHYSTSDVYRIYGDSEQDSFTIETELADGFSPGYYDVRIELYDGDNNQWLLSYGPYEDASLSALPLEDSYYDSYSIIGYPVETEVIISGSGSIGAGLLLIPGLIMFLRRLEGHKYLTR